MGIKISDILLIKSRKHQKSNSWESKSAIKTFASVPVFLFRAQAWLFDLGNGGSTTPFHFASFRLT